ncbi:MAG: SBBP repeat-containing protein, partial [Candidatus Dormibacteria bacterium]
MATNIATSEAVTYTGIYPGIDVAWHGAGKDLEYDFILAAGADPARIALNFDGADHLTLDINGDLLIDMGHGAVLRHRMPVVYQEANGTRQSVQGRYRVSGTSVGFDLGSYDHTRALTIDPLLYS